MESSCLVIGDKNWPVEDLARVLPKGSVPGVWVEGEGWIKRPRVFQKINGQASVCSVNKAVDEWNQHVDEEPQIAIVGFKKTEKTQKAVEKLKETYPDISILRVGARSSKTALGQTKRSVTWSAVLSESIQKELCLLKYQKNVRSLRKLLKDSDRIAILLQGDPDPDGIASALALRKILGRKSQTAMIVSFGHVTRPENVAMCKLLDIEVHTFLPEALEHFDKVVMLDCQPSFFPQHKLKVDAVIDHHPKNNSFLKGIDYIDIQENVGATATMMTHYLLAAGIDIPPRLATALLYGIKTDTLMLNRSVSGLDLDAFVYLYPQIQFSTLRKIERPEWPVAYLSVLKIALSKISLKKGLVIMPAAKIEKEEWVAQLADFASQVEEAKLAVAFGIFEGKLIVSGRALDSKIHCGEIFKEHFADLGSAGGHRSMAKAIIPLRAWSKKHSFSASKTSLLVKKFEKLLRL